MRYSSFILLFLSAALCTTRLTAQNNAGSTAAQNTTGAPDAVGSTLTLPQAVAIAIKNNLLVNQADLTAKGYKISFDFFSKADAVEYAGDVSKLGIDWVAIYSAESFTETSAFRAALAQIIELRDRYEADGYFQPR